MNNMETAKTSLAVQRAQQLLSQMTLEEKAAQMVQISFADTDPEEALVWAQRGVGSFLHVLGDDARRLQAAARGNRLGIPLLFGIDATHGHGLNKNGEIFPAQLGMAASFNEELVRQAAEITAAQVREDGLHWTFSPLLCLGRDLRWGRVNETFGEDKYLAGRLGAAMVRGYQGDTLGGSGRVLACAKHYIAYGESTGGRDSYDSQLSMRKVRDTFLPPFVETLKAGCGSVMAGYQSIDGVPCSASSEILRTILKQEQQFPGFVVTDWKNVNSLIDQQFVAEDMRDACKIAITAGNDMLMNTPEAYEQIIALVNDGELDMALIDDSVLRILTVKYAMGLFDQNDPASEFCTLTPKGKDGFIAVNKALTEQSVVLLKNDGILPVQGSPKKIAVIGPNADDMRNQLGDWTYFTHPHPNPDAVPTRMATTVLGGITKAFAGTDTAIEYVKGCEISDFIDGGAESAAAAAQRADLTILVLGDSIEQAGEAKDRCDLSLPECQQALYNSLRACSAHLVVVMLSSKPLVLTDIVDSSNALLQAFNCGLHGGSAISDIIFGRVNPSGRLPISFPRKGGQLPVYYNQLPGWHGGSYCDCEATALFPFGFGLSYTTFEYGSMETDKDSYTKDDTIHVTLTVKNTGSKDAVETVQLYVHDKVCSMVSPVKQLADYKKLPIAAGETLTVTFRLPVSTLGFVDINNRYVVEPGEFEIMAGGSSRTEDLQLITVRVK